MEENVSLGKIGRETGKEIYQEFNRDIFKPVGNFLMYSSQIFFAMNILPYVGPTVVRECNEIIRESKERDKTKHKLPLSKDIGVIIGAASGVFGLMGQIALYSKAIEKGHPEVLGLLALGNFASAVYEKGRKVKKRLENELVTE